MAFGTTLIAELVTAANDTTGCSVGSLRAPSLALRQMHTQCAVTAYVSDLS
jgi:hypothetical protein